MTNKCIVSVGIGAGQVDFIKAAKKRGYSVAGFGKGNNDIEAIQLCDFSAEIDTSDADMAIGWLSDLPVEIVAVGSFSGGVAIKTLQLITNYFQLETKFDEKCIMGMNKLKQQQIYEEFGLSTINTWMGNELKVENLNNEKKYIVKPQEGRGSKGVLNVSGAELAALIVDKKLKSDDIVQEYFGGAEYRTVLFVQNKKITALIPIRRSSYKNTFFLGELSYIEDDLDMITKFAYKIIDNFHLTTAVLKFDILVDDSKINLIEIDFGVCGGIYFGEYLSALLDYNIIDLYLDVILNQETKRKIVQKTNIIMNYIYNEKKMPIKYDIKMCNHCLKKEYGTNTRVVVNRLHPETKALYSSNSDFIFAVIHKKNEDEQYEINRYINECLFKEDNTL